MPKRTVYIEVAMDVESDSPLPLESELDEAVVDRRHPFVTGLLHEWVHPRSRKHRRDPRSDRRLT